MKPAPVETADIAQAFRQQLILAQIRIMELEDVRVELTSKLARVDRTLTEIQLISTDLIAERDHLANRITDLEAQLMFAQQQLVETRISLDHCETQTRQLQTALIAVEASFKERKARVEELEENLFAIKNSRSWRWMSLLRFIERLLGRKPHE